MARAVRLTLEAEAGFASARRWLLQPGSGSQGKARWDALRAATRTLAEAPYRGAAAPGDPGLRQVIISGHRLLYRVFPDTGQTATVGDVTVIALFGPGQDRSL